MKDRIFWTVEEIISLQNKVFPILGWKGYSDLTLACDNCNNKDLFLFVNINKNVIKRKDVPKIKRKLKKICSEFEVDILWDDMPEKPFATILLSKGEESEW